MLKEDESYASPISVVFYEFYESKEQLISKLEKDKDLIQCVIAKDFISTEIPFGQTQKPNLWDYADRIDTVDFLLKT